MSQLPSKQTTSKIFQFKIKLCDIDPPIWRQVQVISDSTFAEFSDVILKAMGWEDCHMHSFTVKNMETGHKDQITTVFDDIQTYDDEKDEETTQLDTYFSLKNKRHNALIYSWSFSADNRSFAGGYSFVYHGRSS